MAESSGKPADKGSIPVAMTIGGSDPSGGAGIQADLKTFTAMGVYGASAITALTVQNTLGVTGVDLVDPNTVMRQIRAIAIDLPCGATKTGMLANEPIIHIVAETLGLDSIGNIVVDPVMIAKGGDQLIDQKAIGAMVDQMMPLATITTPNRHEAARILDRQMELAGPDDWLAAAREICEKTGAGSCVVKGTKVRDKAVDAFFDGRVGHLLDAPWTETHAVHGSGCVFSAAICAGLAKGYDLGQAVWEAKTFVARAIAHPTGLGGGLGPVNTLG